MHIILDIYLYKISLLHENTETFFSHTESTFFVRHSSDTKRWRQMIQPKVALLYEAFANYVQFIILSVLYGLFYIDEE